MKSAFYAQSGGVTAVINASACGVIESARKHSDKIGYIYKSKYEVLILNYIFQMNLLRHIIFGLLFAHFQQ